MPTCPFEHSITGSPTPKLNYNGGDTSLLLLFLLSNKLTHPRLKQKKDQSIHFLNCLSSQKSRVSWWRGVKPQTGWQLIGARINTPTKKHSHYIHHGQFRVLNLLNIFLACERKLEWLLDLTRHWPDSLNCFCAVLFWPLNSTTLSSKIICVFIFIPNIN